mmetsp:Transcript_23657/g.68000  ORF Transcript_23657/g.68000 Transcript_23657/m.68000 type:complete len:219 (-) Transcript_23657:48-704(-)
MKCRGGTADGVRPSLLDELRLEQTRSRVAQQCHEGRHVSGRQTSGEDVTRIGKSLAVLQLLSLRQRIRHLLRCVDDRLVCRAQLRHGVRHECRDRSFRWQIDVLVIIVVSCTGELRDEGLVDNLSSVLEDGILGAWLDGVWGREDAEGGGDVDEGSEVAVEHNQALGAANEQLSNGLTLHADALEIRAVGVEILVGLEQSIASALPSLGSGRHRRRGR